MLDSRNIATIFKLGYAKRFPGTLGSFVALVFAFLVYYFSNKDTYIILLMISVLLGLWSIHQINKHTVHRDHPHIIIDEWIGMWVALLFLFEINYPLLQTIGIAVLCFIVFRIIDILKFLPPIGTIDKQEHQTPSLIILDDVVGGFYTYAIFMTVFGFYNLHFVYFSFLLLVTPMIANATPVLLRKINILNNPINATLFGANKTWRGLAGGTLAGVISFYLLFKINLMIGVENTSAVILVGFLLSFGALLGDLIKSYFKRKINIKEGESWILFDQVDYVLGAIVLTCFIYPYSLSQIVLMLIIGGILSALSHRLAYAMSMINTRS